MIDCDSDSALMRIQGLAVEAISAARGDTIACVEACGLPPESLCILAPYSLILSISEHVATHTSREP